MSQLYPFRDDYISTSEIGRRLGFPISGRFIIEVLKVKPTIQSRSCHYWSPDEAQQVYKALIHHILEVSHG